MFARLWHLHEYALDWHDTFTFSADQNTTAFKEVAIIRHPRVGEYAFGFITSTLILQVLFLAYPMSTKISLSMLNLNV